MVASDAGLESFSGYRALRVVRLSGDACPASRDDGRAGLRRRDRPAGPFGARFLLAAAKPVRVLQLGTLIGFSLVMIADVLRQNGRGHLNTVDPEQPANLIAWSWAERAGLNEWITFREGRSTDPSIRELMAACGPFDFIYVDSSHAYDATLVEFDLILGQSGWLSKSGLLVLHDAAFGAAQFDQTGRGGVHRALEEWLAPRAEQYQRIVLEPPFCRVSAESGSSSTSPGRLRP